jgi:hypothetical protein
VSAPTISMDYGQFLRPHMARKDLSLSLSPPKEIVVSFFPLLLADIYTRVFCMESAVGTWRKEIKRFKGMYSYFMEWPDSLYCSLIST